MKIQNRKARFEYHIIHSIIAGMVLTGSEVKSVRAGNVNMGDAYCFIKERKLVIKNLHISPYGNAGYSQHDPLREKVLLISKKEMYKLGQSLKEKGLTLIPLEIFISDTGFVKIEIGLAKGKKAFDKRESIKEREVTRSLRRIDE